MKIKPEIIERIKTNSGLRKELIAIMEVNRVTMWTYLRDNSDELTKAAPLRAIASHYNLSTDDVLEETTKAA